MSNQETELKNQEISQEDNEKAFLTDISERTPWIVAGKGHKCPLLLIKEQAPNYWSKLDELKHEEKIEIFGFTFMYFAPKDREGNFIQDKLKMIYRFPPRQGGSSGGGKAQFKPKRTKEVFEGLFPEVQIQLAKPDSKWKLFATHFNQTDGTVIYVLQQEETMS